MSKRSLYLFKVFSILIALISSFYTYTYSDNNQLIIESKFSSFRTDYDKISINPELILDGGPGKDGIPALINPAFDSIRSSKIEDNELGILVVSGSTSKFYPYNILVWHEIVNDSIGKLRFSVTFCPLCGSAVVYNRNLNGETLEFKVTGKLYESNMLMYDTLTESFWSQSTGISVAGYYTGEALKLMPMQLISFKELKSKYPKAKVLSTDTGYNRDYSYYPYKNYDNNQELYFYVSKKDARLPLKEILFAFKYSGKAYAIPLDSIKEGKTEIKIDSKIGSLIKDSSEIRLFIDNKEIAGYYEMWFSWFVQNSENADLLHLKQNSSK